MKKSLNVGAGNKTYKFFPDDTHKCTNVDIRKGLKGIDVVCDVSNLHMFEDGTFDYILANDIIEHFPLSETTRILREWKRVLKVKGIIEFRAPNLKVICEKYVNGTHSTKLTSWLLYGGQDYKENFHHIGFDREFLKSIVVPLGFEEVSYEKAGNNFILKVRRVD
jgi:predicted SAM-dependent methyltransferase